MNINFPPVDKSYIKAKVKSGFYANATELIRDAVRRMREHDEKRDELLAALKLGEEDIEKGRFRVFNDALFVEVVQNAKKKAASGRKPKPEVTP